MNTEIGLEVFVQYLKPWPVLRWVFTNLGMLTTSKTYTADNNAWFFPSGFSVGSLAPYF